MKPSPSWRASPSCAPTRTAGSWCRRGWPTEATVASSATGDKSLAPNLKRSTRPAAPKSSRPTVARAPSPSRRGSRTARRPSARRRPSTATRRAPRRPPGSPPRRPGSSAGSSRRNRCSRRRSATHSCVVQTRSAPSACTTTGPWVDTAAGSATTGARSAWGLGTGPTARGERRRLPGAHWTCRPMGRPSASPTRPRSAAGGRRIRQRPRRQCRRCHRGGRRICRRSRCPRRRCRRCPRR
mmetsp:Transcript_102974/g.291675  ORF Transcript_102974/g.291675 Transcript_102974/m.291675 type:complete len:240 (-) Transcript_102974:249-968(-)